jgi:hypothetical protein
MLSAVKAANGAGNRKPPVKPGAVDLQEVS